MTKPHTSHGSGESLQMEMVTLIMEPIADLVDRTRMEILGELKRIEGLLDAIAGQKKRELDEEQKKSAK